MDDRTADGSETRCRQEEQLQLADWPSGLAGAAAPVQLPDALKDPLHVSHLGDAQVLKEPPALHQQQLHLLSGHRRTKTFTVKEPGRVTLPSGPSSPGEEAPPHGHHVQ